VTEEEVVRVLHIEFRDNGSMTINLKGVDSLELIAAAFQLLLIARNDQTEAGHDDNARLVEAVMEPLDALLQMTGAVYNTEPKSAPVN